MILSKMHRSQNVMTAARARHSKVPGTSSETLPITVVVPVRNEEANLGECLSRLGRFANVIVVDSNSTDRTVYIARSFNAQVLQFVWNGRYPKKRNWVLMNHVVAGSWVLFLDADERVDARFCDEVERAIASGGHSGYWLSYTNYFLGRRLRHGVAQRKLALFRAGCGFYEKIEEDAWSGLDMEVHEHPIIDGALGEIHAPIEHMQSSGIAEFVDRHSDYARWEAQRTLLLAQKDGRATGALTRRQHVKYRYIDRWWYAWGYFLYTYVARLGFLDGAPGFQYAFYKAWYFNTIRLLIAELRASPQCSSQSKRPR